MKALYDIRTDHDLTQKDLASILGISRQYYARYEKGDVEIPLRHLKVLAKYYNVSIDYLSGLITEPEPLWRANLGTQTATKSNELIASYNAATPQIKTAINVLLNIKGDSKQCRD